MTKRREKAYRLAIAACALETARQAGYDAGYADGLVDGSASVFSLDRSPDQLVQQHQVGQVR